MAAEAGWYADPADPAWVRWWDGSAWSSDAQLAEPLAEPVPDPAPTAVPVAAAPAPISLAAPLPEIAIPVLAPSSVRAPAPVLAPGALRAPEAVLVAAGGVPTLEPPPVHHPAPSSMSAPILTTAHPHLGEVGLDTDLVRAAASTFLPEIAGDTHHTTLPSPPSSAYSSSGWDSAIATGSGVARAAATSSFSGVASFDAIGGPAVVVTSGGNRTVKVVVGLVVVAVLLGVGVVLGLPKYRDLRASDTAAATAPLLARTAPNSLAGLKSVSVPGLNPGAAAAGATASGAGWAWAETYGTRADYTYYLAGELPQRARAAAVLAQTDPLALSRLVTELGSGLALGAASTAVLSARTEYSAGVGGKAWCMPVEVSGNGGGYCLWTNGREFLQVLNAPSIPAISAKHALAALQQISARPAPATAK